MPGKSPDIRNRLPSVRELVERPPVRALLDRLGESRVATGVRSYLDELRFELKERLGDSPLRSPGELAERAARYVLGLDAAERLRTVNATGRLVGPPWSVVPMAAAAQQAMLAITGGFALSGTSTEPGTTSALAADTSRILCRLTGSEAAALVHSYEGGLCLALAALAGGKEVVVARGQLGTAVGRPLPDLIAASGAVLREVGATDLVHVSDYEKAITAATAAVLWMHWDTYRIVGNGPGATCDQLIPVVRNRGVTLIEAFDTAALTSTAPQQAGYGGVRTASAGLADGADLVLVRGDGQLGGPPSGIVLGKRALIDRMTSHPHYPAWQLDPLRTAALRKTAQLAYADCEQSLQELPLRRLLSTPVENLRLRAERLAVLLNGASQIELAEAIAVRSRVGGSLTPEWTLDSYAVALSPAGDDVSQLDRWLRHAAPPVIGRQQDQQIVLDLRSVPPEQDQWIVDALTGPPRQESASGGNEPILSAPADTGQQVPIEPAR